MGRRLAFNIRGVYYETYEETLMRFPNTLLGNPILRAPFCNGEKNEFYFDRSHHIFDTILFFYQSGGILAKPDTIDDNEFQDELRFFGIIKDPVAKNLPNAERRKFRQKLWLFMECPESSIFARIFACFSLLMIIISTVTYCLETVNCTALRLCNKPPTSIGHLAPGSLWRILESIYTTWFFVEYILRCTSQPKKRKFIFSVLGIVDLAAILPFLITVLFIQKQNNNVIRLLRFLQIFRILKLTRHSKSLQLLGKSLYYCKGQISLLLVFFFINCLACGSVLYWIEKSSPKSRGTSIMDTMWFCVISMTTVGYGDIVPQTSLGKVMGAVTILVGIVVLFHIFIPVYLSYFALLYELSFLNQLEKEELEKEQDPKPEPKAISKMSTAVSSIRRPRPSVTMSRSPSVGTREGFSPARKQSVVVEDTFMRKIKYDYLRKISSTESPFDWKPSAMDSAVNDSTSSIRSGLRMRTILDSTGSSDTEKDTDHLSYDNNKGSETNISKMSSRGRRKAVVDRPKIFADLYENSQRFPTVLPRQNRSASVTVAPTTSKGRTFSESDDCENKRFLQSHRKALSLQWFNLEHQDAMLEEAESLSDI